jgi:hypothetical protein
VPIRYRPPHMDVCAEKHGRQSHGRSPGQERVLDCNWASAYSCGCRRHPAPYNSAAPNLDEIRADCNTCATFGSGCPATGVQRTPS